MINTEPVDTWWKEGELTTYNLAADVAKHPAVGAIAAIDAAGKVVSAADVTAVKAIGRTEVILPVDEQSGNDESRVTVRRGVIALYNDETAPCAEADLFDTAEIGDDDGSAAAPETGNLALGPIVEIENDRIYVNIDGIA